MPDVVVAPRKARCGAATRAPAAGPSPHPDPVETHAAVAETHISVVTFIGDRAYKLKKPVALGFVDLTERAERERLCHREVELNRRLAPDVYLGVADIVDAAGRPCDHHVVMRRMPAARRLSTLVREGAPVDAELRNIARVMAAFHARTQICRATATPAAVADNWRANLEEMTRFAGTVVDADLLHGVALLASRFVAGRGPLLEGRITGSRIRDGHGDLLADDIFCLDDGPRILDCIEFDDRLRCGDVLADVAFLAMDLERLGAPALAARFLSCYREFSGDPMPQALLHHYIAYRALVRSKIACLRHEQGDAAARAQAGRLLAMAYSHLAEARVVVVLVGGLPGTGKTTLARGIGDSVGWTVVRSDEVRHDIAGVAPGRHARAAFEAGPYDTPTSEATYSELVRRAREMLGAGESVVLDATWTNRRWRALAQEAAAATSSDLVELCCRAPGPMAAERIRTRAAADSDISDATPAVAQQLARRAHTWRRATRIDTSGSPLQALVSALTAIGITAPDRR
jgi:aminoglycoside phosphotransferase family enzyme/predicted kinase